MGFGTASNVIASESQHGLTHRRARVLAVQSVCIPPGFPGLGALRGLVPDTGVGQA